MIRKGDRFTLAKVHQLPLDDSPFLLFTHRDEEAVVQTGHVTYEQLLSVPGFADTLWEFERETHEWIPLFRYVHGLNPPIEQFVDIEPGLGDYEGQLWVTPKGFPREQ